LNSLFRSLNVSLRPIICQLFLGISYDSAFWMSRGLVFVQIRLFSFSSRSLILLLTNINQHCFYLFGRYHYPILAFALIWTSRWCCFIGLILLLKQVWCLLSSSVLHDDLFTVCVNKAHSLGFSGSTSLSVQESVIASHRESPLNELLVYSFSEVKRKGRRCCLELFFWMFGLWCWK
jgi:hypothetical protein